MDIEQYIENINRRYKAGNATEHTFRGDLQQLIESLVPGVSATNEPKRQTCGAPDYILTKHDIPLGYMEAKDIGDTDLDGLKKNGNKEQFDRYKASLSNIFFTDYLDFHLYQDGIKVDSVRIGDFINGRIAPMRAEFPHFTALIKNFCNYKGQTIKSAKKLAEMMAGNARLLSDVIEKALTSDTENEEDSTLRDQMEAFKQILIHDITPKGFADIYAQTIAYGMFAARSHDPNLGTFSRQEAAERIPKTNPFLRKLFSYIAGPDIDDRIKWIVDGLVEIFLACDVKALLKNYGKATKTEDPIIHFYETFLSEYDPKLRKARGVWYTPLPVVDFIVRAVDDILKSEFGLAQGLADTSKTKIKINHQGKQIEQEVHKVQILDPATGTGTFLAEVVKHIYKNFAGQQGIWSNYVETHLLPRLNGFELLMASYAMAHLKLDLLLTDTGYKPTHDQRFRIYLTNSLEQEHPDTGTLFASWLSQEANEANRIKRDTPVMVVLGNPPYAVSSSNKSIGPDGKKTWIGNLIDDYKKDLHERKINLDDDYIKFIRFGQHFIDKNGSGILAYISNNSFIDGITHRQMRKSLLESFDNIYIIDLHGSAKKREITLDGNIDQNVFDIQQGVSINIFVKTKKKKIELGEVLHFDLFGNREKKYSTLSNENLKTIAFEKIDSNSPYFFFVPKQENDIKYDNWPAIDSIFLNVNNGVKTDRDSLFISEKKTDIEQRFKVLLNGNIPQSFVNEFRVVDSGSFKITTRIKGKNYNQEYIEKILYRPFDVRYIYYDPKIVSRPAQKVMKHMLGDNISLLSCRQQSTFNFQHILVAKTLSEVCTVSLQTKETTYVFPLYLYPENTDQLTFTQPTHRTPNLKPEIVNQIAEKLGLRFTPEKEDDPSTFAPIDILDYIYAVLHSPAYREKYKEFLKIDFPRVPYPKDLSTFQKLTNLGGQLRQIHLLESPVVDKFITQYPIDGDNSVTKIKYEDGRVYINDTQYFDYLPDVAWNFYIGGYQPAQKWLKDRKGRKLDFDDITHYQKIIVALTETDRLMKEVDDVGVD